jgi:hypothetical protein
MDTVLTCSCRTTPLTASTAALAPELGAAAVAALAPALGAAAAVMAPPVGRTAAADGRVRDGGRGMGLNFRALEITTGTHCHS